MDNVVYAFSQYADLEFTVVKLDLKSPTLLEFNVSTTLPEPSIKLIVLLPTYKLSADRDGELNPPNITSPVMWTNKLLISSKVISWEE